MEGWVNDDGTPMEWTWPILRKGIQGAYNEVEGLDDDGDMANELQCMNCTTPEGGFNNYGWYVPARAPGRKRLSARASEASAKKVRASEAGATKVRAGEASAKKVRASEASAKKTRDRSERSEANVSARGRSERKEGARGRSERSEANVSGARKRVATAGRRPSRERMCEAAVNKSSRKRAAILGFAPPAKEVL
jgi:hypothetical protein